MFLRNEGMDGLTETLMLVMRYLSIITRLLLLLFCVGYSDVLWHPRHLIERLSLGASSVITAYQDQITFPSGNRIACWEFLGCFWHLLVAMAIMGVLHEHYLIR